MPNRLLSSVPVAYPTSILGVMKETVQHRGVAGLYQGLSSWLFFSFPRAAFRFTTYEACLSAYERYQFGSKREHGPPPPTAVAFMAGSVAGAVESATCMTPMHCIQIKMQQDAELARPRFKGFFHATGRIVREEGVQRGLLAGMGPTILKAAVNNCIRFGVMSELCAMRRKQKGVSTSTALDPLETLTFGGMAGALSAIATHPIDTVKSNMQGNVQHKAQFGPSSMSCFRWIIKTGGVRGLFHGLAPRIVRVTLEVSLSFSLFDLLSRSLDAF